MILYFFLQSKKGLLLRVSLLGIFLLFGLLSKAQVTIGANEPPHNDALLDLKQISGGTSEKGLLLPRVALKATNLPNPLTSHVQGMTVYNIAFSADDGSVAAENYLSPGFYYNDGAKWERLHFSYTNWFFMPSVSFDTANDATGQSKDLYALYKSQFDGTATNSARSTGAPIAIPYIPASKDLYYYITSYDPAVFSNISINENGVMTYDVTAAATDCSYINIVFVIK